MLTVATIRDQAHAQRLLNLLADHHNDACEDGWELAYHLGGPSDAAERIRAFALVDGRIALLDRLRRRISTAHAIEEF